MDNAMAKNFMIESLFAIMKTELLYAEYSKALKSFTKALEERARRNTGLLNK